MKIHANPGISWKCMDFREFHDYSWIFMNFMDFMDFPDFPWKSLKIHGNPWKSWHRRRRSRALVVFRACPCSLVCYLCVEHSIHAALDSQNALGTKCILAKMQDFRKWEKTTTIQRTLLAPYRSARKIYIYIYEIFSFCLSKKKRFWVFWRI